MPLSEKHDDTKTYDDILNAGPPLNQLAKEFVTPTELFFVRNHTQIPTCTWTATGCACDGLVTRELSLSLEEIKITSSAAGLIATLQCAGNRRKEMVSYKPIDDGLAWGIEAIGTAEWTGLRWAIFSPRPASACAEAAHVAFLGLDTLMRDGQARSLRQLHPASIKRWPAKSCWLTR